MTMRESPSRIESPIAFALIAAGVLFIGGVLWLAINAHYPTLSERASFGNIFGGINTLFAGLAFAALAYTLILQQRTLALQRLQLERQQRDLAAQSERAERQAFETMLVQLLGFHHAIASGIDFRSGQRSLEGSTAIRQLADEASGYVANRSREPGKHSSITVAQEGYEAFHERYRGILDHYFRNLYHIVKFIDASGLPNPRRYTSLVRAQLSPAELILLFYNGLSRHGGKFKPLIERYALLEQLPGEQLAIPGHRALYLSGAYGEPVAHVIDDR